MLRPYYIIVCFAVLFNGLGWILNNRFLALIDGLVHTFAMLLFQQYISFLIIQATLSYIAFIKMRKQSIN